MTFERHFIVFVVVLTLDALSASGFPAGPAASSSTHATDPVIVHVGTADPRDPTVLPLLGVISGPDPSPGSPAPNLTPQLHDIGIITIRNNDYFDDRLDIEQIFQCPGGTTYPSWEGCDPTDDSNYHWGPSDAQFQSWMDGGFEPFLRLGGENQSTWVHHDFHGPQDAEQEANWIVAAIRTADRYLHWNGPLWALASTDGRGSLALLVANTGDVPVTWEPDFSGSSSSLTTLDRGWVQQVDGVNHGRTRAELTGWPLEIPGTAVQLVILQPGSRFRPRAARGRVRPWRRD